VTELGGRDHLLNAPRPSKLSAVWHLALFGTQRSLALTAVRTQRSMDLAPSLLDPVVSRTWWNVRLREIVARRLRARSCLAKRITATRDQR